MATNPAFAPRRPPNLVRILNPLIVRLLGAGLPFGPNVMLTVRGRTSGLPRTFPVAIVALHGRRYVQSPFGEVNWVRNLRSDPQAVVTRGRRRDQVEAIELSPEEAGPVLRDAVAPYLRSPFLRPVLGRFFAVHEGATPEDYVAEARRHPMFELRPRDTARGG